MEGRDSFSTSLSEESSFSGTDSTKVLFEEAAWIIDCNFFPFFDKISSTRNHQSRIIVALLENRIGLTEKMKERNALKPAVNANVEC